MKSLRTGAALLALLFLALYARPLYSQAQTLMFGSYLNAAKAVTVTSAGAVNVSISGGAGVVPCANGGTGLSSYAVGDLIYASAACTLSKLADVATGSVLVSGGVGVAPAWSTSPTLTALVVTNTSTSATDIFINKTVSGGAKLLIDNLSTNAAAFAQLGVENATGNGYFTLYSHNHATFPDHAALSGTLLDVQSTGALDFYTSSYDSTHKFMSLSTAGILTFANSGYPNPTTMAVGSATGKAAALYVNPATDIAGIRVDTGNESVTDRAFQVIRSSAEKMYIDQNGGFFTAGIQPITDAVNDLGANGKRFRDYWGSRSMGVGVSPTGTTGEIQSLSLIVNGVTLTNATTGVAASYKIARGATAFDGSNPTTVATGLTTVVSCTATMRLTAALTTGTAFVTHAAPSGANVDFYAWVIAGTASTGTETFDWVCVGT